MKSENKHSKKISVKISCSHNSVRRLKERDRSSAFGYRPSGISSGHHVVLKLYNCRMCNTDQSGDSSEVPSGPRLATRLSAVLPPAQRPVTGGRSDLLALTSAATSQGREPVRHRAAALLLGRRRPGLYEHYFWSQRTPHIRHNRSLTTRTHQY